MARKVFESISDQRKALEDIIFDFKYIYKLNENLFNQLKGS